MSLYKRNNSYIHFIHVPKTGGTSIRKVLENNSWIDVTPDTPEDMRSELVSLNNSKSNHQHRNFWSRWEYKIEHQWSVVRNPYDRSVSQILSQIREIDTDISNFTNYDLTKFLKLVFENSLEGPEGIGDFDNHFRPQVDFLGEKTAVFRLEDELNLLNDYLVKNNIISLYDKIPILNKRKTNTPATAKTTKKATTQIKKQSQ